MPKTGVSTKFLIKMKPIKIMPLDPPMNCLNDGVKLKF